MCVWWFDFAEIRDQKNQNKKIQLILMKAIPFIDLTSNKLQPELHHLQLLRFEVVAAHAAASNNTDGYHSREVKSAKLILNTIQHIVRNKNQFSEVNNETIDKLKSLSIILRKNLFQPLRNEENETKVDLHGDGDCDLVDDSIPSLTNVSTDGTLVKKNGKSNKAFEAAKAKVTSSNNNKPAPFFSDTISAENIQTLLLDQRVLT